MKSLSPNVEKRGNRRRNVTARAEGRRLIAAGLALSFFCSAELAARDGERLIDREPFDRIILDEENGGQSLDVLPLQHPAVLNGTPFPKSGELEFRLAEAPTRLLQVPWHNVVAIQTFRDLLIDEARQFAADEKFDDAFDAFSYLNTNYPKTPRLDTAFNDYLYRHAFDSYKRRQFDDALSVITTLYARQPDRQGLDRAVERIANAVIKDRFDSQDYAAVWRHLETLPRRFGDLNVALIEQWKKKLEALGDARIAAASRLLEEKNYDDARAAVRAARAILPGSVDASRLEAAIHRAHPSVVVAASELLSGAPSGRLDDGTSRRLSGLLSRPLVELRGFSAEGGVHASSFGELVSDAAAKRLTIRLNRDAAKDGPPIDAFDLARLLLRKLQNDESASSRLADHLAAIEVEDADTLHLDWRGTHVQPESLLSIELTSPSGDPSDLSDSGAVKGAFRVIDSTAEKTRFENRVLENDSLVEVIELRFEQEADALEALRKGEVDVIERISPWNVAIARNLPNVEIGWYALPTVHMIVINPDRPLLVEDSMRRALAYGIDRKSILERVLLAGENKSACKLISGPFPLGRELSSPISYAYNRQVNQRDYAPHLAATLATVAREARATGPSSEEGSPIAPLRLAHPPNDFARTICQVIAQQLRQALIPVELVEATNGELAAGEIPWDLRYAEVAMWEPVADASQLLGPDGEAGIQSAYLALALRRVDEARNWPEVREQLQAVHRVVHNELPVIPLWQTVNAFAYRKNLSGVGELPMNLYDNITNWRKEVVAPER